MPSPANILLVEGVRPALSLAPILKDKGYHLTRASNGKEAINRLKADAPALVVVDCTTLHTDGTKICVEIRAHFESMPILIVVRTEADLEKIDCADAALARPFTPRKLINRVKLFLPDDAGEMLRTGDYALNIDSRYLRMGKREFHLTPMQTRLMETFMRKPNELLSRAYLMKTVWKTNYTGDTRTIEVHVRWLREMIEDNPKKPARLITVRHKGYQLIIE